MKRPLILKLALVITVATAVVITAYADRAQADPTFGVDTPSVPPAAGALLDPVFRGPVAGPTGLPTTVIPAGALGVFAPPANVDDISFGDDCTPFIGGCPAGAIHVPFSVDRVAVGFPGSGVAAQVAPPELSAAPDVFVNPGPFAGVPGCGPAPNVQIIDGDGMIGGVASATNGVGLGLVEVGVPIDNLDSLEWLDYTAVDTAAPPLAQDAPIFFTVDPATAAAIGGISPADVLVSGPPFTAVGLFAVYAPAGVLGLDSLGIATDNIDGLAVFWNGVAAPFPVAGGAGSVIFYSLAPGSASLAPAASLPTVCFGLAATSGDLWGVPSPGVGPLAAGPFLDAEMLGLCTARIGVPCAADDNLDAFDIVYASMVDTDLDGLSNTIDPDDDNDNLGDNAELMTYTTVPFVADTDGDGCVDGEEVDTGRGVDQGGDGVINQLDGGRRNPLSMFDYYDTPSPPSYQGAPGSMKNRFVGIEDIAGLRAKFGSATGGDGFNDDPGNDAAIDEDPADGVNNDPGNDLLIDEDGAMGGGAAGADMYHPDFDRTPLGPDAWDTGVGDGSIFTIDLALMRAQYGHSCVMAPN